MRTSLLLAGLAAVAWVGPVARGLDAFPGAQGFGAVSVGGRGGQVIKVTNLNASGPGSLQAACSASGPRTVVFDVSGVIHGNVVITNPYITIAGQTAPGAGITIEGMLKSYYGGAGTHDVIVRHLRIRPQRVIGETGDAIQMGGSGAARIILDHCSVSWAVDECIDMIHAQNVTVQWSTVEESDMEGHTKGMHNYGFLDAYDGAGNVTLHHNLFAHHYRRVPSLTPYEPGMPGDFRNNVAYNINSGFTPSGHGPYQKAPVNLIGNWYGRGPNNVGVGSDGTNMAWSLYPFAMESGSKEVYIADNYIKDWGYVGDPRDWVSGQVPSWVGWNRNGIKLAAPAAVAPVTTETALEAYRTVLAQAGCWPRDRVTTRTVLEVQTGTGQWGRNAPLVPGDAWFLEGLSVGLAPRDSDNDGMPDDWELARGLNPGNPADRNSIVPAGASPCDRHAGYTYLEYYLNDLAEYLVLGPGPLPGDADLDGYVDLPDLVLLARNWHKDPAGWGEGNFDGDTITDLADLIILARNWHLGTPARVTAGAVPGPAALPLLALGAMALLRRRPGPRKELRLVRPAR